MEHQQNYNSTNKFEDEEFRRYQVTRWRRLSTVSLERFRDLLQNDDIAECFDEDYVESVSNRWRELIKVEIKLGIAVFLMIIIMGAIDSGVVRQVDIFGISISMEKSTISILLLVSSFLVVFMSIISLIREYYGAAIRSFVEVRRDSQIREYYMLRFGWSLFAFAEGFEFENQKIAPNSIVFLLIVLLISALLLVSTIVVVVESFIFVSAIFSVYQNPIFPAVINVPILIIAICAALISTTKFILTLPLPYTDNSNVEKILEIEQLDPERAERIRNHIAVESLRKGRRNVMIAQFSVVIISFVFFHLILYGTDLFSDYSILISLALVLSIFVVLVSPLLDLFERRVILSMANIKDTASKVKIYVRDKKRVFKIRLVISFVFSAILFACIELIKIQDVEACQIQWHYLTF